MGYGQPSCHRGGAERFRPARCETRVIFEVLSDHPEQPAELVANHFRLRAAQGPLRRQGIVLRGPPSLDRWQNTDFSGH